MSEDILNIAIIGAGYWGKNLVRNFATTQRCSLKYVCDRNENILAKHKANFPFIQVSADFDNVLCDSEVDAVVIATEASAHFEIAKLYQRLLQDIDIGFRNRVS